MQFYENTLILYKVFTQTNEDRAFLYFKTLSYTFFCRHLLEFTRDKAEYVFHLFTIIGWSNPSNPNSLVCIFINLNVCAWLSCHHQKLLSLFKAYHLQNKVPLEWPESCEIRTVIVKILRQHRKPLKILLSLSLPNKVTEKYF